MSHYGKHPSLNSIEEPIDTAVWHWFICNGPHGERFSWHKDSPHPKRDIELLEDFVNEREQGNPGFAKKARLISLDALKNEDPVIVITGIQVLTVVGSIDDFEAVGKLCQHADERISKNARTAIFERGIKVKKF